MFSKKVFLYYFECYVYQIDGLYASINKDLRLLSTSTILIRFLLKFVLSRICIKSRKIRNSGMNPVFCLPYNNVTPALSTTYFTNVGNSKIRHWPNTAIESSRAMANIWEFSLKLRKQIFRTTYFLYKNVLSKTL